MEGASGSFGPVETKRLGLPQPLVFHQKGTTWLATAFSLAAPRAVVERFHSLRAERLGLPQPLVWQQQFGTRKGTTWLATASSLAAPRARLAGLTRLKQLVWLEKERLGLPQP